jgi:hypothetical protein
MSSTGIEAVSEEILDLMVENDDDYYYGWDPNAYDCGDEDDLDVEKFFRGKERAQRRANLRLPPFNPPDGWEHGPMTFSEHQEEVRHNEWREMYMSKKKAAEEARKAAGIVEPAIDWSPLSLNPDALKLMGSVAIDWSALSLIPK